MFEVYLKKMFRKKIKERHKTMQCKKLSEIKKKSIKKKIKLRKHKV